MIFESYKPVILIHFKIAYGKQKTSKHKLRKCSSLRKYELILNLMAAMPHKEVGAGSCLPLCGTASSFNNCR